MWLFLSDAFLSIVAHNDDPDLLLVRARVAGDIERVFPTAHVITTPRNDYAYRAFIPRREVAAVVASQVQNIRYPNFKSSIHDPVRHQIYFGVYNAALRLADMMHSITRRRSQIPMFADEIPF